MFGNWYDLNISLFVVKYYYYKEIENSTNPLLGRDSFFSLPNTILLKETGSNTTHLASFR